MDIERLEYAERSVGNVIDGDTRDHGRRARNGRYRHWVHCAAALPHAPRA